MLITPPTAASPYKALALPRSISMRSICWIGISITSKEPIWSTGARMPSITMAVLMLSCPRKKKEVTAPGPPLRPNSKPASPCSKSARVCACERSMSLRVMTDRDDSTSASGCSTRMAVTTTCCSAVALSADCAKPEVEEKAAARAIGSAAKRARELPVFIGKRPSIKPSPSSPTAHGRHSCTQACNHFIGRYPG